MKRRLLQTTGEGVTVSRQVGLPNEVAGRAPMDGDLGLEAGAVAARSAPGGPVLGVGKVQRGRDARHKEMRFDMVFLRYAVGSLTGLRNLADNFACAPNSASLLQQVEADRFIGTIEHDTLQRLDNSWS